MNVAEYWQARYVEGKRQSGLGSRGEILQWKAERLSGLLAEHAVTSTLDIGSGDGHLAGLLQAPDYLGVDVSPEAVRIARLQAPQHRFDILDGPDPRDAHLSTDVIFHLVDDDGFDAHIRLLFSARTLAIAHSTDHDEQPNVNHVRHRNWTASVPDGWVCAGEDHHGLTAAWLTWWVRK